MNIVITGCAKSENIGFKIANAILKGDPNHKIIAINHPLMRMTFVEKTLLNDADEFICDLSKENSVDIVANTIAEHYEGIGGIDMFIHAAGNNYMSWFQDINMKHFQVVMSVNFESPLRITQHFQSQLKENKGTVLNIISTAANAPMRCSLAYNCSKAALQMATLQLGRELSPDITVFGINPNKFSGTGMTKANDKEIARVRGWSEEEYKAAEMKNCLAGELTDPDVFADFVANILSSKRNHKYLTGTVLQYGA